jgi:N-acetylglucosamine-6-phosphate deacetylase
MTETSQAIMAALTNIRRSMRRGLEGASLLGAHLEGPYIDSARRGCHDPALVRSAQLEEYARYLESGVVRIITLAPELPGNDQLVEVAHQENVVVSAGHTRASYEELLSAARRGVSMVTHLYNGMEPMHHRNPGAVGAALQLGELRCELIADNLHVHPAMLDLALRCKGPDRIVLVTDAMRGTGMPEGKYALGGLTVSVRSGAARLADGTLAGSTLTLNRAVRNMAAATGLTVTEALPMASLNPARVLGLAHRKGTLAPGMDADLILVDDEMHVALTMVAGRIVHRSPDRAPLVAL